MDSGVSGANLGSPTYCATCGRPVTAGLTACPNCGTPLPVTATGATTQTYSAPTVPSGPMFQAATAAENSQAPTWQTPPAYAAPAYAAPAAPKKRGRRGLVMGGIAAVLVIALLGTGVAYVLGAFAGHSELDAAKYLPANTFVFSGIDVYSLAENSHNISLNTLINSGSDGTLKGAGLDWANDVLPWLGRDVAAGAFPSTANSDLRVSVAGLALIQSHDDAKAQAAMKKAADSGASGAATASTYNGFTLYSQPQFSDGFDNSSSVLGMTFTAGKGWAVIATDPAAAKTIIDRLNGTGDTLATQQVFQNATDNLPDSRFGTLYVNVHSLELLIPSDQLTPEVKQALDTYPVGTGYTSWTNAGLHAQVTLNVANNSGAQYPSGDAAALASAIPSNAYAYVSVGNLGGDITAGAKQLGGDASSSLTQTLGVPLTDPALQQPAALAVFPSSSDTSAGIGAALLLKAPDAAAATTLVQQIATANNCTIATSDVDPAAQAITCPAFDLSSLGLGGSDFTDGTVDSSTAPLLVEQSKGVLIFAADDTSLQAVVSAQSGANLAQAATFKSLVGQAPAGAQTLIYADVSALITVLGVATISLDGATPAPTATSTSPFQPTALLISSVSDSSKTQVSIDLALK